MSVRSQVSRYICLIILVDVVPISPFTSVEVHHRRGKLPPSFTLSQSVFLCHLLPVILPRALPTSFLPSPAIGAYPASRSPSSSLPLTCNRCLSNCKKAVSLYRVICAPSRFASMNGQDREQRARARQDMVRHHAGAVTSFLTAELSNMFPNQERIASVKCPTLIGARPLSSPKRACNDPACSVNGFPHSACKILGCISIRNGGS